MKTPFRKTGSVLALLLTAAMLSGFGSGSGGSGGSGSGSGGSKVSDGNKGLNATAMQELRAAGLDKYLGKFAPISSEDVGDGWVKHTFDPDGGNGPICIAGTPYSVFTRDGSKKDLLIFDQGGGACWQDFYQCNVLAEAQSPEGVEGEGIFDFNAKDNPFANHSIVYLPYCDGSVFIGDNDVADTNFPLGPVRFHRGLRNQSAGMDIAKSVYPKAKRITVAGSSAGGVGAASLAPFMARLQYGNKVKLTVFNDAGPIAVNPDATGDIIARANDWQFDQFFPASCTDCDAFGDSSAIIKWRLANDTTIREAFYETDADLTNRFFMALVFDPVRFREIVVDTHGMINAQYPDRYKQFIVAGDDSHTALQSELFYVQDALGIFLNDWTKAFLRNKKGWKNLVEPPLAP
ncbi:MAG: pectin acetylesterase-family hydrolase [Pseudomonadales bacterium]